MRPRLRPSCPLPPSRASSSASSTRWKTRQASDKFARDARSSGLRSRAAYKLLEIDDKYRLFRKGHTVVDLGYAPGSWSQVALERTAGGRVLGIDLLPTVPPPGVTGVTGDFLQPAVQAQVKALLRRPAQPLAQSGAESPDAAAAAAAADAAAPPDRPVDIVLSDMLMNTSGVAFRDHAVSMDLCAAALAFAVDTLRPGGHLVCKFYAGAEDRVLEQRLRGLFARVCREKPEASRSASKEAYFVALRFKKGRKGGVDADG